MSGDIFARLDEPPDPKPGDWIRGKKSLAVVASGPSGTCVLATVGPHVQYAIEAIGSNTDEVFDCMVPNGISVFEGSYVGGHRTWSGDYDDPELHGTFRAPTEPELAAILAGRCPWDEREWLVPGEPICEVTGDLCATADAAADAASCDCPVCCRFFEARAT